MMLEPDIRNHLLSRLSVLYCDDSGQLVTQPAPEHLCFVILGPVPLPVTWQRRTHAFQWYAFARCPGDILSLDNQGEALVRLFAENDDNTNSILIMGNLEHAESPLVRIHSCCATGDIFGSQRCECGPQLRRAQQMVIEEGEGAILYLADHEGRGIGLFAKAAAYLLQDLGYDTYEANRKLGFPDDMRHFGEAAAVLNFLRGPGKPIRLISNNPAKKQALESGGVLVSSLVPLIMDINPYNQRYVQTKQEYGHLFQDAASTVLPTDEQDGDRSPRQARTNGMGHAFSSHSRGVR